MITSPLHEVETPASGRSRVDGQEERVEIVVKGRKTDVPERFRQHVQVKLAKLERLDHKVFRVDAELSKERNPRLSGVCDRIELTVYSRGPVIRAEAAAADPYAALDLASAKLQERLRRAADRRAKRHAASHAGAASPRSAAPRPVEPGTVVGATVAQDVPADAAGRYEPPDEGPLVVREKTHVAAPMTLDDALHQMELVGHDFYLYCDKATGLPSVVYRRRGYDYGVLRLRTEPEEARRADLGPSAQGAEAAAVGAHVAKG